MSVAGRITLCLGMLTLVGCVVTRDDLGVVQRDLDEMKGRLFTVNKEVDQVQKDVKEGIEKSLVGYRQTLESLQKDMQGFQKDMAGVRKGGADLQATLDNARVDMQLLTGKVDDVRIMAQKPAEDLQLLREDLAKRLSALEERLRGVEAKLTELEKKRAEVPPTPESLYQQGLDAYRGGDPGKAREILGKFLERHPKHELAANARYWMGESYYAEKNFEQAILEFQEVIKNHPDKEKVPAAMLKQGMAFKELGDPKSAAYIFKKITEEFPKSEEAKVAKERLRQK